MHLNALIADEGNDHSRLTSILEPQGITCFLGRGPLKIRELLNMHPIDLIVWCENGESQALTSDLIEIWKSFLQIPLFHLFPDNSFSIDYGFMKTSFHIHTASISEKLAPTVIQHFMSIQSDGIPSSKNELKFKKIFSKSKIISKEPLTSTKIPISNTVINPKEREMLKITTGKSLKNPLSGFISSLFNR